MNLSRLQKNFDSLASEDPLWTVLSDNQKRGGGWDPEAFYSHGEQEIVGLEQRLATAAVTLAGDTALDFGCGVGRITFPLSRRFKLAIGVDISAPMIEHAQQNANRGESCRFIVNTKPDLSCIESATLDFAYSNIVFQHMAPRYAKGYIREIARALKPGGHFVFQLPSHLDKRSPINQQRFRAVRRRLFYLQKNLLQRIGKSAAFMEMNGIPCEKTLGYVRNKAGLRPLALWDYAASGPNWHSYLYLFRKD